MAIGTGVAGSLSERCQEARHPFGLVVCADAEILCEMRSACRGAFELHEACSFKQAQIQLRHRTSIDVAFIDAELLENPETQLAEIAGWWDPIQVLMVPDPMLLDAPSWGPGGRMRAGVQLLTDRPAKRTTIVALRRAALLRDI